MSQCSDTVWQTAKEIMEDNRARDDTQDAAAQKLHMFTHPQQSEPSSLPDGETRRQHNLPEGIKELHAAGCGFPCSV